MKRYRKVDRLPAGTPRDGSVAKDEEQWCVDWLGSLAVSHRDTHPATAERLDQLQQGSFAEADDFPLLERATHHRIVVLSAFGIDTPMPMIFGRPSWPAGVVWHQVTTSKKTSPVGHFMLRQSWLPQDNILKHDPTAPTNELVERESFPEEPAAASGRNVGCGNVGKTLLVDHSWQATN